MIDIRQARQDEHQHLRPEPKVPVFIPEVSIESQRSSGYTDTLSAVNELVDNALDARATMVRIYYLPRGKASDRSHDIVVLDNGTGMDAEALQNSLAFGGGNRFDRQGIGRFAYGLPNAAISQGQRLEVYSWQRPNETYKAVLDVQAVKEGRQRGIDDPELESVPTPLKRELLRSIGDFPGGDEQLAHLLAVDNWPDHGTLVHISECDQLTWKSTKPFVEHSWVLGRIYRYRIWSNNVQIYVNNRLIQPVDPLYLNPKARHFGAAPYGDELRIAIPLWDPALAETKSDNTELKTADVVVRLSRLPTSWMADEMKVNKNQRKIYEHTQMSVLRAERELELAFFKLLGQKEEDPDNWWGGEMHIPPVLDEAFGVTNNKQGVHPKAYVRDTLARTLRPIIADLRKRIIKERLDERKMRKGREPTFIERRAAQADTLIATMRTIPTDPSYQEQVEREMLRFAQRYLRDGETPQTALERIRKSLYLLEYEYHPEGPFYRIEIFGRIIVVFVNRAHAFFDKVWEPLSKLEDTSSTTSVEQTGATPQSALAMLLFTIARVEVDWMGQEPKEEWFRDMRARWSSTLSTFLRALD